MAQFKYKPIDPDTRIDAMQWPGESVGSLADHAAAIELYTWIGGDTILKGNEVTAADPALASWWSDDGPDPKHEILLLWVEKSNRMCEVRPGDYIIRESDGDGFYPCVAEVFNARYEPADD